MTHPICKVDRTEVVTGDWTHSGALVINDFRPATTGVSGLTFATNPTSVVAVHDTSGTLLGYIKCFPTV